MSDLASVGLLMKVFPPGVVDEVIARCGRTEQRRRALPARSVAYFTMGMALHSHGSYHDVLSLVSDGMAWADRDEVRRRLANKAAISHARDRLGPEPMRGLFERVAVPLAARDAPGSWLAGRWLVTIDGTCLDLADTPANRAHFGRPAVLEGEPAPFPQARVVAVAECGTNAIFDAAVGRYTTSESTLSEDLLARLTPGTLCLDDRGRYSRTAWETASRTGAHLLWRVADNRPLDFVTELPDGSYLAEMLEPHAARHPRHPRRVRVIEQVEAGAGRKGDRQRLITTLLDPDEASAAELTAAHGRRWELDAALDELRTGRSRPRPALRSRSPDLVVQEIWGHLCCHYAIRTLLVPTTPDRPGPARSLVRRGVGPASDGTSPAR
ncbi:IS4 family transposase [Intrasporangium sp.]|uniref:IS4 family transposase n=1 Tax=Intrasporangium sp. TaxID=1925024 RepID=UPI003221812C